MPVDGASWRIPIPVNSPADPYAMTLAFRPAYFIVVGKPYFAQELDLSIETIKSHALSVVLVAISIWMLQVGVLPFFVMIPNLAGRPKIFLSSASETAEHNAWTACRSVDARMCPSGGTAVAIRSTQVRPFGATIDAQSFRPPTPPGAVGVAVARDVTVLGTVGLVVTGRATEDLVVEAGVDMDVVIDGTAVAEVAGVDRSGAELGEESATGAAVPRTARESDARVHPATESIKNPPTTTMKDVIRRSTISPQETSLTFHRT